MRYIFVTSLSFTVRFILSDLHGSKWHFFHAVFDGARSDSGCRRKRYIEGCGKVGKRSTIHLTQIHPNTIGILWYLRYIKYWCLDPETPPFSIEDFFRYFSLNHRSPWWHHGGQSTGKAPRWNRISDYKQKPPRLVRPAGGETNMMPKHCLSVRKLNIRETVSKESEEKMS